MIGQFDDDYFLEMSQEARTSSQNYSVKCVNSEWYMNDPKVDVDNEEAAQIYKCRADRAYHVAKYDMALTYYLRLLWHQGNLTPHLYREVKDSIARTYLKLGRCVAALQMALHLDEQSKSNEQHVCSWILQAKVHHQMKNYQCEILTYSQLLQLHPQNGIFWAGLAEAFALHWGVDVTGVLGSSSEEIFIGKPSLVAGLGPNFVRLVLGACCIRARIIYKSFPKRLKGQGLPQRLKPCPTRVENWLRVLSLPDHFLKTAMQILGRDVMGEKDDLLEFENLTKGQQTECRQLLEDGTLTQTQFYQQWFGWIHDHNW